MITSIIHQILCLGCSPLPISLTTRVVRVSQMALHPVVSRHVYCWGEGQESYVVSQHSGPVNEKAKCYMYNLCKEKGDLCDLCADLPLMSSKQTDCYFFLIYWKVQLNLFRSIIWIVWDVQNCDMYAERMWQCIHVLERCNWIRSVCVCMCVCGGGGAGGGGGGGGERARFRERKGEKAEPWNAREHQCHGSCRGSNFGSERTSIQSL